MQLPTGKTVAKAILGVVLLLIIVSLFIPPQSGPGTGRKAMAKNDVTQLATACIAFETEYGHLPGTGRQVVSGDLLATLMGSNTVTNPKKIAFMEFPPYRKRIGGITNGTFLDPWGGPYQIAFAPDGILKAGTNNIELHKKVAVWNDPAQTAPPPWWQSWMVNRAGRYITSWD